MLAYNLGNLWRRLVLPRRIDSWSLTSLQQRLVKTGGTAGEARALLLAPVGRESPDPTSVQVDAPADLGPAGADGLTRDPLTEGIWRSNDARTDRYLSDALKWRGFHSVRGRTVFPRADFESEKNAAKLFPPTGGPVL